jgi:CarD family transcriptional regulator
MIANTKSNNKNAATATAAKKKAAAERISKQAAEQARKPLKTAAAETASTQAKQAKSAPAKAAPAKPAQPKAPQQAKPVAPVAPAPKAAAAPKPAAPAPAKAAKPAPEAKKPEAPAAPKKAPEPQVQAKKANQRQGFKTHEYIVYPAHGVGQIMAIEEQEVAGYKLELFVISFAKDKMTLRVPTTKVAAVGMRKLAEPTLVKRALDTLKGRARIKRTMWSRRAQEYEAKINSGDIVAIAEVVRDLYRSESQPEQSYSERQLYEAALDRLAREIAAVDRVTETEAIKQIEGALAKGPRRGPKNAEGEGGDADDEGFVADEAA